MDGPCTGNELLNKGTLCTLGTWTHLSDLGTNKGHHFSKLLRTTTTNFLHDQISCQASRFCSYKLLHATEVSKLKMTLLKNASEDTPLIKNRYTIKGVQGEPAWHGVINLPGQVSGRRG